MILTLSIRSLLSKRMEILKGEHLKELAKVKDAEAIKAETLLAKKDIVKCKRLMETLREVYGISAIILYYTE